MIYESIDLTPYATGKFWIGAEDEQNINNYDTNQKGYKDFTINGDGWYCAAVWPMAATVYNSASIDSVEDYNLRARIHSSSGASYLMPRKTSTVSDKEAIILTGYGSTKSVTMDINKSYDSLSFLVAHSDNLQRAGMKVSIAYSGEEPLEAVSLDALPFSAEEDNLLADLSDKNATPNKSAHYSFAYPYKNLYIYEYSIDTDPSKEIDTITFAGVWDETSTSHNNFGIVALSGGIAAELTGKSYVSVDLSGYTTSKGYIAVSEANAAYSKTNFIAGGTYPNTYAAIKWPVSLREREEGSTFPEQAAEISIEGDTPVLTSEKSGIPYTFPAKGTSTDMLMLDDVRSGISYNWGTVKSKTIDISGNYESVSFLAASATASSSMSLDVTATYTDGSTAVMDTIAVPGASDTEQSANDSFVADVSSMKYRDSTDNNGTRTSTFEFAEPIISANSIALYEYTLELDTSKVLKSLTFTEARTSGIGNQGIYISAITGRRLDYASGKAEGTLSSFKCVDSLTGEDISEAVNGKSFDIEFSVENLSLYELNLNVFTAAYDRKGNLVTADKQSVTAAPGQSSHVINSNFPEDSFEYAKIMVWDDNLKPYVCKVVSIGDGTQSMVDLSEFANGKFYVSADNAEELHISTYTGAEGNALGRFDFPW
ncbi:MAG: hypothetical protein IJ454_03410, partial [Clostridia bacterium]|nr:hypothetical protein [Clostridia bacterium]